MQFAINYSPQAAELLDAGRIQPDRFKCPPWPDLIAEARRHAPVYVHFDLRADAQTNRTLDFEEIEGFRQETATPFVNLHLSPERDHFPHMAHDSTDPADIAAVTESMIDGVRQVIDRFGAAQVIVENLPYYGGRHGGIRPAVEPAVIRRVVEETGAGFLLDISHARLAAQHIGMDANDYLAQMPGEVLRELHVTGIGRDPQGLVCDHLGLTAEDWPYVEWVLARIRAGVWAQPWVLAFEYGGITPLFDWRSDPEVIATQVPRLVELAASI